MRDQIPDADFLPAGLPEEEPPPSHSPSACPLHLAGGQ